MVYYKTDEEIEIIRECSLLVSKTLAEVAKVIKDGVSTLYLDQVAEEFIRSHNALPAFLGYNGFPNTLCISVNEEVVHGIPSERIIKNGDIVSVDCGVKKHGFFGDSAFTFAIGEISEEKRSLLEATKDALYKGIEMAVEGHRLGDIGYAIQQHVQPKGYSVVREMVGHGIGKDLHEDPQVPNYGKKGSGLILRNGLVIAIEPMINIGRKEVKIAKNEWTVFTVDKKPSAHFEHTVAIRKEKAEILSTFEYIEEVLNQI